MKTKQQTKRLRAQRRRKILHVRRKIRTHGSTPRLTVFRSNKNIYSQIVDDEAGRTLVSASSRDKTVRDSLSGKKKSEVAVEVGKLLRETIHSSQDENAPEGEARFTASMLLAGQIKGMEPRLFMIYPEGNFIEASWDTPFFQVGETKYGRPILLRAYDRALNFEDSVRLLLVSFDSTLKANLSVGMPLDLLVIERDNYAPLYERRFERSDPYFQAVSSGWGDALKDALEELPPYSFKLR